MSQVLYTVAKGLLKFYHVEMVLIKNIDNEAPWYTH